MSSSAPSSETPPTPSSLHVPGAFLQTTPTIRSLILPAFLDLSDTTDAVVRDLARQADSFTRATNEEAVVDLFKPVLRTAFYHQNISGLPQVTVEKIDFSSMNVCGARDWRESVVHQAILRYMDSMRPNAPASDASIGSRATGSNNSQSSSNRGARKPDFMLVLSSASKIPVHSELKSNPATVRSSTGSRVTTDTDLPRGVAYASTTTHHRAVSAPDSTSSQSVPATGIVGPTEEVATVQETVWMLPFLVGDFKFIRITLWKLLCQVLAYTLQIEFAHGAVHGVFVRMTAFGRLVVLTQQLVAIEVTAPDVEQIASLPPESMTLLDPDTTALIRQLEAAGSPVRSLRSMRPFFEGSGAIRPPHDVLDPATNPVPLAQGAIHRLQKFLHEAAAPLLGWPAGRPLTPLPRLPMRRLEELLSDFVAEIAIIVDDDGVETLAANLRSLGKGVKRRGNTAPEEGPAKKKQGGGSSTGKDAAGETGKGSSTRRRGAADKGPPTESIPPTQHQSSPSNDIDPLESISLDGSETEDDFDVSSCPIVLEGVHLAAVTPRQMDALSRLISEAKTQLSTQGESEQEQGSGKDTAAEPEGSGHVRSGTNGSLQD